MIRSSLIYFLAFNELLPSVNFLLHAFFYSSSFAIPVFLCSPLLLSLLSLFDSPDLTSYLLRGSQSRALEVRAGERAGLSATRFTRAEASRVTTRYYML